MTETTGPPKARRKPTAEQAARYNLRKRLRDTGARIDAFADDLQRVLTDRSGNHYWAHRPGRLLCEGHTRKGSRDRPSLSDQVARIETEAVGGCAASAAWLEHFGPVFALCLELQHETPPQRAPDYDATVELQATAHPDQWEWVAEEMARRGTAVEPDAGDSEWEWAEYEGAD